MEIRQLRYFLSVADSHSFVSAASALYISRQAISKAIGQLEDELGVELFARDSNGAYLTQAGMLFYDRVRAIIMETDSLKTEMQCFNAKNHRKVRLTFSVGAMQLYESKLLQYLYAQDQADIEYCEAPEEQTITRLLEHRADVAVTSAETRDPLLSSHELLRSRFGILIQDRAALGELRSVEIKDLSWLPLASYADRQVLDLCEKYHMSIRYHGYDYYRLISLVISGKCAMVIPQCLVTGQIPGTMWIPIEIPDMWKLQIIYSRSVENNTTYRSVLEELDRRVLRPGSASKQDTSGSDFLKVESFV